MKTFIDIWQLLSPKAEYVNNIFDLISDKLSKGKFVDYNPLFAIKNHIVQKHSRQTLSFNDYYAKYGTTEERDGWKMTNPTGNQVIYVKN